MKLSSKGRYGLRAIIDLADYGETKPVSVSEIALRQGISANYLEQLLPKLRKAGIIKSERGAMGGYQLAKPAQEITVGDILQALEENLSLVDCLNQSFEQTTKKDRYHSTCKTSDTCVAKLVWKRIGDSIYDAMNSIFLSELVEMSRNNRGSNKETINLK